MSLAPIDFIALININGSSALFSADLAAVSRNANTHLFSGCACLVKGTGMAERSCIKAGGGTAAPLGADGRTLGHNATGSVAHDSGSLGVHGSYDQAIWYRINLDTLIPHAFGQYLLKLQCQVGPI